MYILFIAVHYGKIFEILIGKVKGYSKYPFWVDKRKFTGTKFCRKLQYCNWSVGNLAEILQETYLPLIAACYGKVFEVLLDMVKSFSNNILYAWYAYTCRGKNSGTAF